MSGAGDGDPITRLPRRRRLVAAPGRSSPPLSCRNETARPEATIQCLESQQHPNPHLWAGFGARAAKGTRLKNVRKTLIVAAITGTLVTVPATGIAHAEAGCGSGVRLGLTRKQPAPDAPPVDAPPVRNSPGFDPNQPAPDAPPVDAPPAPEFAGFDPNLPAPDARTVERSRAGSQGVQRELGRDRGNASPVVTGGSAPVTATRVVCSSPPSTWHANGGSGSAPAPAVRSRSGWPRMCCTRRASAHGRSAADVADQPKNNRA